MTINKAKNVHLTKERIVNKIKHGLRANNEPAEPASYYYRAYSLGICLVPEAPLFMFLVRRLGTMSLS